MSSSGYTAMLLRMLDIPDMRGWVSDENGHRMIMDPWAMLFSAFVYHSNRDFNSMNLVDIFRCSAGVSMHPKSLRYEVADSAKDFAEQFLESNGLRGSGPLIAIQAGASQEKRQWSPPRFAHLCRMLIEKLDARLIFTGSGGEQKIIDAIFSVYKHPQMVSAVGKTDLPQLASLLQRSQVLITGDTGTMHLSVAVGTPVVANFLASALCFETGPYSEGNLVVQPQISCSPCNPNLKCSQYDCHDQVPPELLFELTKLRLERSTEELLELDFSSQFAHPSQAAVFVTTFDDDNYLLFKPMNGSASRNGFPAHYYDGAREAYRTLWKNEFLDIPMREWSEASRIMAISPDIIEGIGELRALTERGIQTIDNLERLIKDPSSPAYLLGEANEAISTLDREIEHVGLNHGILGAVVRMFIMEKENLRGDDPLVLAYAVKRLYDTLKRRTERFAKLYTYHATRLVQETRREAPQETREYLS